MKSSFVNKIEGKLRQIKGKAKELFGKIIKDSEIENAGRDESFSGKIQEKIGHAQKYDSM